MTNADDTTNLSDQLAAHRRTLAVYLRQLASLGADHAPPGVHNGIAEARAAIARLKAALRAAGVAVEDEIGDVAMPDEEMLPPALAHSGPASVHISGGQVIGAVVGANYGSITTNYHAAPARPSIDPIAAQALLDRLPLDQVPTVAPLPPGTRMPLRPNPQFVGRDADLLALAAVLKGTPAVDSVGAATRGRPPAAVITTGIGGVGKTQLAAEVAHRYGRFFAGGVFWLSFADPTGIDAEIAACGAAGALELYSDAAGLTLAEQVAKVYAAWAQPIPRLLICDNCDDLPGATAEQQLADRLPTSGGCRVLVTSRRGRWSSGLGLTAHPLGVLVRAASIALLRGHRPDLADADADTIAAELGDLPLALTLAGSYLHTYRDAAFGLPATYLANLRAMLLDHRSLQGAGAAPSLTGHEVNVQATFNLSYQRLDLVDSTDALAIQLLARASYLAPGEPFPRQLLLAMLGAKPEDEDAAAQREDARGRLVALGLLEGAEDGALRIHRLIAAFARTAVSDDAALGAVEVVLNRIAYVINTGGVPAPMQPLLAHLRHATERALERGDAHAATLCTNLGYYLNMIGDYAAARPLLERALAIREQALGPSHPDTASSLNNLAELLRAQGDYSAARPLLERALAITEQALGSTHLDTAQSLNNLAALLESQGDDAAARLLFERALAIREQALGSTHLDTAQSLNNLAALLASQGDYSAARPLYERALTIREHSLGPTHPDTALSLNNLAALLYAQGDYGAARPLYERALTICEQTLGPTHPSTALSLNNLAGLLYAQGDTLTAQKHYERALAIRETMLGPDHPDTAQSRWGLGGLLAHTGDRPGARAQVQRAVAIYTRALGAQHPTTQRCQRALAALNAPAPSVEEEIADLTAQAEAAVAAALADPTSDRADLAARLEAVAQQAEEGEAASSPYVALAAHLRGLATQLVAAEQQIADLTAQAEAAVAAALADPTSDRADLAAYLEAVAQQAADGEEEGSPYLALAAHLRALAAQLDISNEAQERAALLQRAQAATDRARAEGDAITCAALAERLIVTADAYAGGEKPGSQRYNLATHLRALAAQLIATDVADTDPP